MQVILVMYLLSNVCVCVGIILSQRIQMNSCYLMDFQIFFKFMLGNINCNIYIFITNIAILILFHKIAVILDYVTNIMTV